MKQSFLLETVQIAYFNRAHLRLCCLFVQRRLQVVTNLSLPRWTTFL